VAHRKLRQTCEDQRKYPFCGSRPSRAQCRRPSRRQGYRRAQRWLWAWIARQPVARPCASGRLDLASAPRHVAQAVPRSRALFSQCGGAWVRIVQDRQCDVLTLSLATLLSQRRRRLRPDQAR
jgi:hypothetical protein